MPYYIDWFTENHIIYIYLDGKLEKGEMASVSDRLNHLATVAPEKRVHLLMEDATFEGIKNLAESREFSVPSNIDIILSCNQNAIQQFLGRVIAQLSGKNIRFIKSPLDGLQKLARMEGRTDEEFDAWQQRLIVLEQQAQSMN